MLDSNFNYAGWHIEDCFQHADNGVKDSTAIDLDIIFRRLINSASHGNFELNTQFSSGHDYEIVFKDVNLKGSGTTKNFYLKIKAINLVKILEKIELQFKIMYP